MSLLFIVALPFFGALLPGLMNAAGRAACAGVTFTVSLAAFVAQRPCQIEREEEGWMETLEKVAGDEINQCKQLPTDRLVAVLPLFAL